MRKINVGKVALFLLITSILFLSLAGHFLLSDWTDLTSAGKVVDEQRSFSAELVENVAVATINADVQVSLSDSEEIIVRLHGYSSQINQGFKVNQEGNTIGIVVNPEAKLFSIGNRLTLDIQLPRLSYQEIAVSTTSGDVSLHQLLGQLLKIETVSGDVDVLSFPGEMSVKTISGDVCLTGENAGIRVRSTSGDVDLDLPENAEFTLEAGSISGEVSCALPITIEDMANKGHLHGKVNGGGVLFDLNTTSGDVRIF